MKLLIAKLNKDGLQTRVALDERTVTDYAEAMRDGAKFPPVEVFYDATNNKHWLADGFHRVEAALRAGEADIEADIAHGTFADALRHALRCNTRHGLRLTNADKKNALQMAWAHRAELWPRKDGADPSAGVLADACGVHANTAQEFLRGIQPPQNVEVGQQCSAMIQPPQNVEVDQLPKMPVRRVFGIDGRTRTMPTRPVRTPSLPVYKDIHGGKHCVPIDRFGVEIPIPLQAAFNADNASKLEQLVRQISEARCLYKRETAAGNIAFAAVRQEVAFELDTAYNFVAAAAPHCVCRMCQGNGCKACHGRGWQTEEEYDRNPSEFKDEGVQA